MSDKNKDVLVRAGKTFFQALIATALTQIIAVLGAGGNATLEPKALLVTIGLPALAAGLSAVQNIIFPPTEAQDNNADKNE